VIDERAATAAKWVKPPGTINCLIECPYGMNGNGLPPCTGPGGTINRECPYAGQQVKYRYAIPTPDDVEEAIRVFRDELGEPDAQDQPSVAAQERTGPHPLHLGRTTPLCGPGGGDVRDPGEPSDEFDEAIQELHRRLLTWEKTSDNGTILWCRLEGPVPAYLQGTVQLCEEGCVAWCQG
jgi:hypothetical protein